MRPPDRSSRTARAAVGAPVPQGVGRPEVTAATKAVRVAVKGCGGAAALGRAHPAQKRPQRFRAEKPVLRLIGARPPLGNPPASAPVETDSRSTRSTLVIANTTSASTKEKPARAARLHAPDAGEGGGVKLQPARARPAGRAAA